MPPATSSTRSPGRRLRGAVRPPELGGMGQWSTGGMLMIGDMFNNGLKAGSLPCATTSCRSSPNCRGSRPAAGASAERGGPRSWASRRVRAPRTTPLRRVPADAPPRDPVRRPAPRSTTPATTSSAGYRSSRVTGGPSPSPASTARSASTTCGWVDGTAPADSGMPALPRRAGRGAGGDAGGPLAARGPGRTRRRRRRRPSDPWSGWRSCTAKGILTEAEFAAKKSELLARL